MQREREQLQRYTSEKNVWLLKIQERKLYTDLVIKAKLL